MASEWDDLREESEKRPRVCMGFGDEEQHVPTTHMVVSRERVAALLRERDGLAEHIEDVEAQFRADECPSKPGQSFEGCHRAALSLLLTAEAERDEARAEVERMRDGASYGCEDCQGEDGVETWAFCPHCGEAQ